MSRNCFPELLLGFQPKFAGTAIANIPSAGLKMHVHTLLFGWLFWVWPRFFGVRWQFINRSVRTRLQVSVCSSYNLCLETASPRAPTGLPTENSRRRHCKHPISWLENAYSRPFVRIALLTRKVGQIDLVFGVWWHFISGSVRARLPVCSNLCRPG